MFLLRSLASHEVEVAHVQSRIVAAWRSCFVRAVTSCWENKEKYGVIFFVFDVRNIIKWLFFSYSRLPESYLYKLIIQKLNRSRRFFFIPERYVKSGEEQISRTFFFLLLNVHFLFFQCLTRKKKNSKLPRHLYFLFFFLSHSNVPCMQCLTKEKKNSTGITETTLIIFLSFLRVLFVSFLI